MDCTIAVQPTTITVPVAGGTFEITIASSPQCAWTASVSEPWLALETSSGKGPQTLSLRVSDNPNASERNAQIRVAEQTLAIHQVALAAPPPRATTVPPVTPTPPVTPAPPALCTY